MYLNMLWTYLTNVWISSAKEVKKVQRLQNTQQDQYETLVSFEMPSKSTLTTKGLNKACMTSTGHETEIWTVTLAAYTNDTKLLKMFPVVCKFTSVEPTESLGQTKKALDSG